jgi:hypothetical protein
MALELFTRKLGEGDWRAAAASIETTHQRGCGVAFLQGLILSLGTMVLARPPQRIAANTPAASSRASHHSGFGLERLATAVMNNPG